ncbi:MAG: GNAT family N-acetyltransferase [Deltaproteobacteria bacterium]|jgi:putative acetyltransferase|nr:GNAT family N-acetyltransferase [Deltaproteobacteria bacterium]
MSILDDYVIQIFAVEERSLILVERLLVIWEDSVRATHHFLEEADIQAILPEVRAVLKELPILAVISDPRQRPLGFLAQKENKIEAFFLASQARGRGLGRKLIEWAIAGGAKEVDVNTQNTEALGFYLHLGFKVISVHFDTEKPYGDLYLLKLETQLSEPPEKTNPLDQAKRAGLGV